LFSDNVTEPHATADQTTHEVTAANPSVELELNRSHEHFDDLLDKYEETDTPLANAQKQSSENLFIQDTNDTEKSFHFDNLMERMNSIDSPVDEQNTYETEPYRSPPKQNIDSLFDSLLSKHIDDDE
jgi:uncharacterized protein YdcH (DUF465 family)